MTFSVASSLVCTSPLAIITDVGLLDVLMVSNSAARSTHSSAGEYNVALSFSLSLKILSHESSSHFEASCILVIDVASVVLLLFQEL